MTLSLVRLLLLLLLDVAGATGAAARRRVARISTLWLYDEASELALTTEALPRAVNGVYSTHCFDGLYICTYTFKSIGSTPKSGAGDVCIARERSQLPAAHGSTFITSLYDQLLLTFSSDCCLMGGADARKGVVLPALVQVLPGCVLCFSILLTMSSQRSLQTWPSEHTHLPATCALGLHMHAPPPLGTCHTHPHSS
jgi:hypothetical protein